MRPVDRATPPGTERGIRLLGTKKQCDLQRHLALFFTSGGSGWLISHECSVNLKELRNNLILVAKVKGTPPELPSYGRSHAEETGHRRGHKNESEIESSDIVGCSYDRTIILFRADVRTEFN